MTLVSCSHRNLPAGLRGTRHDRPETGESGRSRGFKDTLCSGCFAKSSSEVDELVYGETRTKHPHRQQGDDHFRSVDDEPHLENQKAERQRIAGSALTDEE
jgi:hypothetical protein